MENNKYRKFYIDWWNIKRSTIYSAVFTIVFLSALIGGIWYAWKKDWFLAATEATNIPQDAGKLMSFEGDVRIIRATTRETILVTKTTYVLAGDTIQTQGDGRATVQMIDGSTLAIRPNSTVVIRDSSSLFGGKNVRVALDDGQINVKTEDQPDNTKNVVEVMESENRLLPQTDASFNTNPTTNGGEIRISRGGVETNVGGQTTVIKENEFASVNNGKLNAKEKIIGAPKPVSPDNSAQLLDTSGRGAAAAFRWQNSETVTGANYALQISKSPYFAADAILLEKQSLANGNFTLNDVPPGTYYWRVRVTSGSGQTSDWCEPWKFSVVKRGGSQTIAAGEWKIEPVGGTIYRIAGKTQPGATVRIQGRETFAQADGSFMLQVSSSLSETVVEISDDRGNKTTYALSLKTATAVQRF